MYSLVLMTALTTAPDGPEFNGFFQNLFHGGGCSGSSSASGCTGYSAPQYSYYGGCCGSSYNYGSCCGGSGYYAGCSGSSSGFLSRVRRWFHGDCCGGCCGG